MRTATSRIMGMVVCAASAGFAARAFASTVVKEDGSGIVIWGFLGFCAVILVGQLLPALISFLSARRVLESRVQEELAAKLEAERVQSAFDRE